MPKHGAYGPGQHAGEDGGGALHLDSDVFVVPHNTPGSFILYAPLKALALVINEQAASFIGALRDAASGAPPAEFVAPLLQLGILSSRRSPPRVSDRPAESSFAPTNLALFLTSNCNLRCSYCYSSGGDRPDTMPLAMALDAVSIVVANAAASGRKASVHFHGGGEPTLALDTMMNVVHHATSLCERRGVPLDLSLGTNGVMSEAAANRVARCMTHITLSIDGGPEVHDRQRMHADGRPSYADVLRTIRVFDASGCAYSLRVTVTEQSVGRLDEVIEHLVRISAARQIKAEPLFVHGRARTRSMRPPDPEQFIESYSRAKAVTRAAGRALTYSGCRPETVTDRFCAAPGHSTCLTPTGELTACYEITHRDDERASTFFFGRYCPDTGGFEAVPEALARLRTLTMLNAPECRDCFAKWHCAGDCPAKALSSDSLASTAPLARTWRCRINRELTRRELIHLVDQGEDLLVLRQEPTERDLGPLHHERDCG